MSDEFKEKFNAFILAFEKSNLNTEYLLGQSANQTRTAYGEFLQCERYQVNDNE